MIRYIIGIKPCGNDSSCFILDLETKKYFGFLSERFTRIKHDKSSILRFIDNSILDDSIIISSTKVSKLTLYYYYLLPNIYKYLGINSIKDLNSINNINKLSVIKKGILNRENTPKSFNNLFNRIKYLDHHLSHIYASYFFSGFKNNILGITMDGEGDGYSSCYYYFNNNNISTIYKNKSINLEDIDGYEKLISIGSLYSLFTKTLGFYPQSDEGKVEALSSYGSLDNNLYLFISNTIYLDELKITFNLDKCKVLFSEKFLKKERVKVGDYNFAYTIQYFLEAITIKLIKKIIISFPNTEGIVLGGGIFKNIKLNYSIFNNIDKKLYIPVFSGDEGTGIGAALNEYKNISKEYFYINIKNPPYFGNNYTSKYIQEYIEQKGLKYEYINNNIIYTNISNNILNGKVIGLFQGKAEFGPRSLGNRAILANAYDKNIKDVLNNKIKKRSGFQPFCPSILDRDRENLFEKSYYNNIMTSVFKVKSKYRKILSSVIHIDGTSRPQFVKKDDNDFLYNILLEIKKYKGLGICLNTSFNIHGKTIVETPEDAIEDSILMGLDIIYFGNYKVYIN